MSTPPTITTVASRKLAQKVLVSPVMRSFFYLFAAYVLMCLFLSWIAPNFFTARNFVNVFRQMSMIAIIGVGMTMVIVGAEIDLSVGSVAAFSGVLTALMAVQWKWPMPVALTATLLVAACSGAIIGLLRVTLRIPSFITSLGLLTALRSGAFLMSGGFPISPLPPSFDFLGNGLVGPIPVPVILMVIIYALGYVAMTQIPWGRELYAVGGNEEAARLSGISVARIKISIFVITAALAGFAGIILASRLNSGTPAVAVGWELDVIAAVIIGGTSLFGGSGGLPGTILGALFMATIQDGMVLMGLSPFSQGVVSGIVIVAAVVAGTLQTRSRR